VRTTPRAATLGVIIYLVLVVLSGALASGLELTRAAGPGVRALVAAASVLPLAVVLGACLPAGLGVVAKAHADRLPWLWAVNAATSVLGAVVATFVMIQAGLLVASWCALACYALAWVSSPR
jgi:hypothetical protein